MNAPVVDSMRRRFPLAALLTVAVATTACSPAQPTMAAARAPEAFPTQGASTLELRHWLERNSRLKPEDYISIGDRYAVALVSTDFGGQWVRTTNVRIEVVAADFAARLGGRSASLTADVDCSSKAAKPKQMTVFADSDLRGRGETLNFPDRWIISGQGAYLDDVVGAACDASFRRPFDTSQVAAAGPANLGPGAALTPSARLGAYAPPVAASADPPLLPPPPIQPVPAAAKPPAAPPPPALKPSIAAPPPVTPAPVPARAAPVQAKPVAPPPTAKPAVPPPVRVATAPPKPAPVPTAAPPQAKPAPPPPARVATAPPPAAKPAAPPPKAAAAAAGGFFVQVAASPTLAGADQAWTAAAARSALIRGRTKRVQTIAADGKTFYRVMVAGFADRAAAQGFCASLKQAGQDCLVRAE